MVGALGCGLALLYIHQRLAGRSLALSGCRLAYQRARRYFCWICQGSSRSGCATKCVGFWGMGFCLSACKAAECFMKVLSLLAAHCAHLSVPQSALKAASASAGRLSVPGSARQHLFPLTAGAFSAAPTLVCKVSRAVQERRVASVVWLGFI